MCRIILLLLLATTVHGFVVTPHVSVARTLPPVVASSSLSFMVDPNLLEQSSSFMIAETEPWVQPLSSVLGPFLNLFSFAMTPLNEFPWALVVWPTEALLRAIRGAVPPAFGVDITPIVWLGIFTFLNEILLGQQGLLTMKIKYGI